MTALYIFYLLIESFILYPFSKNRRIIIKALLNKHSYRFPAFMQIDFKAPIYYYRHALFFLFKKQKCNIKTLSTNTSVAIFDGKTSNIHDRFEYLKKLKTPIPGIGISRDNLCIQKTTTKIIAWFLVSILSSFLAPIAFISLKRKATISIIILEYLEWVALFETLKINKCCYLYHFCSYEKDSPFIGWINEKYGIIDHKVPSSNPLKNFYKYTYCDILSITTPFQTPEINLLSHNWRVKKYINWPIENFQKILPYINKTDSLQIKKHQLAFLSSGIWLRQKQQHSSLNIGDQDSELKLLDYLKEYLGINKNISFIILLHPIEKKTDEIYTEACKHYQSFFNNISLNIGKKDKNSFEYFNITDTTIAAYSSTNLQRLFCGYKTLYAPLKFKTKIYENSAIQNIAATNKLKLFNLLDNVLSQSEKEFFSNFHLQEYHYSSYNLF